MPTVNELYLDVIQGQLLAQSAWYDLHNMDRCRSISRRIARQFLTMQKPLGTTCFVEIGAHEAAFSLSARQEYPNAYIYAFEANPHVYARYCTQFTPESGLNIRYENTAVGNYDGMIDFLLAEKIGGVEEPLESSRNSFMPRTGTGHSYHSTAVPVTRLATFAERESLNEETFCLWIDAEGCSRQVLEGAETLLPRVTSMLIEVEIEPIWEGQWTAGPLMLWCRERGFIPVLRDFARPRQYNCLFVNLDFYSRAEHSIWRYIQDSITERLHYIKGI